ncbi:hypothetical protein THAOC_02846 [Thalassiosira oceanica]|uniref:Uncharacterized protein n=1 Tax=Thalassiosira oceanica TaxID=159749 RepID=K0TE41_THAOC|nr:hypothetical protein THAOC_02846 [Thalassiosira oceanica]|eukprot:EJK75429.1 hypothetical protein THAOC_02846 [Thalassiosira oceanica]
MCATTSSLKQIPAVLGQGELEDPSPANDGKSQPRPPAVPPYTVVITAHPIPSHPSLEHIERTMDSLELLNPKPAHVILACDYPQKLHEKYRQFKEAFRVRYPHVEIVAKDSPWEGICGNVKSGFGAAKTEFILTVQVTIALDVIFPECEKRGKPVSMEAVMEVFQNRESHNMTGTFIYGPLDFGNQLKHTDGSEVPWRKANARKKPDPAHRDIMEGYDYSQTKEVFLVKVVLNGCQAVDEVVERQKSVLRVSSHNVAHRQQKAGNLQGDGVAGNRHMHGTWGEKVHGLEGHCSEPKKKGPGGTGLMN